MEGRFALTGRPAGDDYALSEHRTLVAPLRWDGAGLPESIFLAGVGALPTARLEPFGLLEDVEPEEKLVARWSEPAANGRPVFGFYAAGGRRRGGGFPGWVDGELVFSWTPDWPRTPCPADSLLGAMRAKAARNSCPERGG